MSHAPILFLLVVGVVVVDEGTNGLLSPGNDCTSGANCGLCNLVLIVSRGKTLAHVTTPAIPPQTKLFTEKLVPTSPSLPSIIRLEIS